MEGGVSVFVTTFLAGDELSRVELSQCELDGMMTLEGLAEQDAASEEEDVDAPDDTDVDVLVEGVEMDDDELVVGEVEEAIEPGENREN